MCLQRPRAGGLHTHPIARGKRPRVGHQPHTSHDPTGVASAYFRRKTGCVCKGFTFGDLHVHLSLCPSISMPICFRDQSILSPCPEGTRLGEANLHNRRCLSRRVRYLRTEATPTYPRPKGGTSYTPHRGCIRLSLQKKSAFICVICG